MAVRHAARAAVLPGLARPRVGALARTLALVHRPHRGRPLSAQHLGLWLISREPPRPPAGGRLVHKGQGDPSRGEQGAREPCEDRGPWALEQSRAVPRSPMASRILPSADSSH